MTVHAVNLALLKRAKNSVIGNPTAKLALAHDDTFIAALVDCVGNPLFTGDPQALAAHDEVRIEAAHVIASLSYGSSDALRTLLRFNAHQAFLYAISVFQPTEPPRLKAAFARALRALAVAIADAVGPSQWGLRNDAPVDVRNEARMALDYLFQVDILDIYLPLLTEPSLQTSTPIAQLLGSAVRNEEHQAAVADWLPPVERLKEVKGKRGWEKLDATKSPSRQGGWVTRQLTALLQRKDSKVQEAVLGAVACLARDNPTVAAGLAKASPDREATLTLILSFCRSRVTEVRLSACHCATQIIRAGFGNYALAVDDSPVLTVMYAVNHCIESESESPHTRTKACFTLYRLVRDKKELCDIAEQRGALDKLAKLIKDITPTDQSPEWQEDELESISCLREAAFMAVAAISLFHDKIRCQVTDGLGLVPAIQVSLSHPHLGVRYAACQCVRSISRSVAVLRTNIVDSGVGMAAYRLFQKQDEDRQVTFAASSVVCNLVNECSPLRNVLIDQGLLPRLVQLFHSGDSNLRLNALWAVKNLLYHASSDVKRRVMDAIGWHNFAILLMDPDPTIQEQAFHVARHIADNTDDVELLFHELGCDVLGLVAMGMQSENDDVLHQAICVLANIANSPTRQDNILSNVRLLEALKQCLTDSKVEVRRPAVGCILELVKANPRSHKALHDVGIDSTLRHIGDYAGSAMSMSPIVRYSAGLNLSMEDEVREKAREALHWLEHGAEMYI
ncbi:ARM repeat-containing protein [Fomitopsis serialis]|uniref:ARM repeat-containing protein n=1 Tax=Fomitopsis serialis TaxID=139415 RepID=UPI0020088E12|nr:ARM repeat-containing protein [Neoantrodia serialis]KAH9930763.1 ARM repeat-containing protein [Neoantrodia serialis]